MQLLLVRDITLLVVPLKYTEVAFFIEITNDYINNTYCCIFLKFFHRSFHKLTFFLIIIYLRKMEVVQNGGNLDPTNPVTGNMGRFVCIFATLYDQKK